MLRSDRASCAIRIRCRKRILTQSCSRDRRRLLKTLSSFVLSRSNHSTYPHRVRRVVLTPCGLAGKCFEQMRRELSMTNDSLVQSLHSHLTWWGLKRFTTDADYFAWQQTQFSPADLVELNTLIERKRGGERSAEIAFYDLTARLQIFPVLYSQRYEYYHQVGSHVAACIGDADRILDFGCGIGALTTFYAAQYSGKQFVGIDRSPVSIARAREKARELGLSNLRFECVDIESGNFNGSYDLVVATHALVQAEQDPGIPSHNWQTFERACDAKQQALFEQRTGIGVRLDRLGALLVKSGRMIVFEKTRQLARRVPFQRALATRGLQLAEAPELIRYQLVEEVADDGPFYVVEKTGRVLLDWDESPEPD